MEGMPKNPLEEEYKNPEFAEKMLVTWGGFDLEYLFKKDFDEKKQGPLEDYKNNFPDFVDKFNKDHGRTDGDMDKLGEPVYTKTYETAWGDKYEAKLYLGGFVQISPERS